MLEPKEIDTYFNASSVKKRKKTNISQHTRLVCTAKMTLPFFASILVLCLIIWPTLENDGKEFGIDFIIPKGDIEKLNIEKTTIYVTDTKNRINNFTAAQIKESSSSSQKLDLSAPEAIIPLANKDWLNIKSPDGIFDRQTSVLRLSNAVNIFYSKGMDINASDVYLDFKNNKAYSNSVISGNGFMGKINSQGFNFSKSDGIFTFTGKSSLLINEEYFNKE